MFILGKLPIDLTPAVLLSRTKDTVIKYVCFICEATLFRRTFLVEDIFKLKCYDLVCRS